MTWTTHRPSATRTALRAGAFVAVLASAALLLTACSSGSSSAQAKPAGSVSASASASGNSSGKNGTQDMEAYRTCLTQHGVKMPSFAGRPSGRPSGQGGNRPSGRPSGRASGGGNGGGYGGFGGFGGASADPATQKAMQACESLRPQFNGQRGGGAGADSTALKAFTSCLKDHGVVLPTTSPSAGSGSGGKGGTGFGAMRGINTADPKTAKAYETCKVLLPQRPSGGPAATTSPSAT